MEIKDLVDLKKELDHIFESGANEIRVLEMVNTFIDRRYVLKSEAQQAYNSGYNDGAREASNDISKMI